MKKAARRKPSQPKPGSRLERSFAFHWSALADLHPPPEAEHRFHATRRWRFDFAWPELWVAVEIEGGQWSHQAGAAAHQRGKGFAEDCEKYNAAVQLGWRVLRYTTSDIDGRPVQVVQEVMSVLKQAAAAAAELRELRSLLANREHQVQNLAREIDRLTELLNP